MRTRDLLLVPAALLVATLGFALLQRDTRRPLPTAPNPEPSPGAPTPGAPTIEVEALPGAAPERSAVPAAAAKRAATVDFAAEYRDADADALAIYLEQVCAERDAIRDRIAERRGLAHDWTRVATAPHTSTDVAALVRQDVERRFPGRRAYKLSRFRGGPGYQEAIGFAEGEDDELDACMQRLDWLQRRIEIVGGTSFAGASTCPVPGAAK